MWSWPLILGLRPSSIWWRTLLTRCRVYPSCFTTTMLLPNWEILRKNQNGFRRNQFTSQILTIKFWVFVQNNLYASLLFVDFSEAFDSIHRGKVEQIFLAYGPLWEIVELLMMIYKKHESKSTLTGSRCRLLCHCHWCAARGYISAIFIHNLPRLCTSDVNRLNERKKLYTGKVKKQTIPHTNYYGCGLCRYHSASIKITRSGQIFAAVWSGQQMA